MVNPSPPPSHRSRFKLLDDAEIDAQPSPEWRIDGLVPRGGMTVLFGRSGVGKSFLGLDWASCVAAGQDWHGRTVEPGPVVYVAAEGAAGLAKRRRAWKQNHGLTSAPDFHLVPITVPLLDPLGVGAFVTAVQARLGEINPAMVVFDTLAASMLGGD